MSPKNRGISLIITAGEETGSHGANHLVKLGHVIGKAGAIVVGEPTSNYPMVGHKGALWIEAQASGVTAHGSMPEEGINAIYKAAKAVVLLEKYDFDIPPHPFLGAPTLNVGTISGGKNINSVPDQATVGIDIRVVPGQSNNDIYRRLQSHLGGHVKLNRLMDLGSVASDPKYEWIHQVFDIMEPILKERPVARGVSYFTDASVLTPAFDYPPSVILGPGEARMAHKTDEFCSISGIQTATEVYFRIAERWCEL
jgi:succinyl-diaminopimelate desuccinylase